MNRGCRLETRALAYISYRRGISISLNIILNVTVDSVDSLLGLTFRLKI